MEPQETNPPDSEEPSRSAADEALRRLEERLGRASEAAERLIAEASGSVRAAASGSPDPSNVRSAPAGEDIRSAPAGDDIRSAPAGEDIRSAPAGEDIRSAPAGDDIRSAPASDDATATPKPPPAGWQIPTGEQDRRRDGDLDLLLQVIHDLRDLIPPDLQRRLAEALRELLLAIRALIDWYLERNQARRGAGADVQDIPIT